MFNLGAALMGGYQYFIAMMKQRVTWQNCSASGNDEE
jgi:hypothetical protein